ncbi:hypothetical protein BC941DRAFT_411465, partial [Chlamydoabsidia padenii]
MSMWSDLKINDNLYNVDRFWILLYTHHKSSRERFIGMAVSWSAVKIYIMTCGLSPKIEKDMCVFILMMTMLFFFFFDGK